MHSRFPQFYFYKKSIKGDEKGLLRYRWDAASNLSCYIVFRPLESEAYEIRIGWSNLDRCPVSTIKLASKTDIYNFNLNEMMVNTIAIANRNGLAHWPFWEPDEDITRDPVKYAAAFVDFQMKNLGEKEAEDIVSDAVELGMQELEVHGVPYLEEKISHFKKNTEQP